MLNLISSVLQQECKQESENLDKGRITGSAASPRKIAPSPEWRMVSRIFIPGPWQVWNIILSNVLGGISAGVEMSLVSARRQLLMLIAVIQKSSASWRIVDGARFPMLKY